MCGTRGWTKKSYALVDGTTDHSYAKLKELQFSSVNLGNSLFKQRAF